MWKKGPLPPDTYNWGGVVLHETKGAGFFFADFCGDHVILHAGGPGRLIHPHEVKFFNNSIELPNEKEIT